MFAWLYLGTVYQTMRSLLYNRRTSAAQTESLDLMKMNKVTSIVKQLAKSKTNKITKVIRNVPYSSNTQIHSSGMDWTRNKIKR